MTTPEPLVIERIIKAPVQRVWQALTDPADLKQWLPFLADFKPQVGAETRFDLGPSPDKQYHHISRVLEVVENQKLTYTWQYEGYPGVSHISFELSPEGDKTKLRLTQTVLEAFPADNSDFSQENARMGWNWTADALKKYAEEA
jgi:uncharacterized protein YndB with AHSA1/START domain